MEIQSMAEPFERFNDEFLAERFATIRQTLSDMGFKCWCKPIEANYDPQSVSRGTALGIDQFVISAVISYTDEGAVSLILLAQTSGEAPFFRDTIQFLPGAFEAHAAVLWIENHLPLSQVLMKADVPVPPASRQSRAGFQI
jgi:hypothetical protein